MLIKKDTILEVDHVRKGKFTGIAIKDFDDKEEFYPIALYQNKELGSVFLQGMPGGWEKGDEVPCRSSLCRIKALDDKSV